MPSSIRKSDNAWLVCLSAGLFFFYVFMQMNIFDVINQPLRSTFHINAAQLSWMSSTFVWASILLFIPAGIMIDRYSTRLIILYAMAICVAGTFGFALTDSYLLACIFHSFTGIANAFCFLACFTLVYQYFPPERHAFVTGSLIAMAFFGGMIAHTPFAYLSQFVGWRHAVLFDALLGVIILGWLFLTIENKELGHHTAETTLSGWESFKKIIAHKQNWLAGLYTSCLNLPIMVLCALWGALYIQKVHNIAAIESSYIMSFTLLGSMIGGPLFGFFSDKLGKRKPVMLLGAFLTFLAMLTLILFSNLSFAHVSLLFFGLGLLSSSQIIGYPLIAESNCSNTTGIATAMASTLITGGGGLGQALFGILLQHDNKGIAQAFSVADFQYAIIILPVAALVAGLLVIGMQETYCSSLSIKQS